MRRCLTATAVAVRKSRRAAPARRQGSRIKLAPQGLPAGPRTPSPPAPPPPASPPRRAGARVTIPRTPQPQGTARTPQDNSAPSSFQGVRPTAGPLGMGNRNVPSNAAGRNLPALPPAHGEAAVNNRAGGATPQGNGSNPTTQASRGPRGPFGTNTPAAPNVATGSAGQGLRDLPTNRQQMQRPPVPQAHVAQPPTLPTGS